MASPRPKYTSAGVRLPRLSCCGGCCSGRRKRRRRRRVGREGSSSPRGPGSSGSGASARSCPGSAGGSARRGRGHALALEPGGEVGCDIGRAVVAEQPRPVEDAAVWQPDGARASSGVSVRSRRAWWCRASRDDVPGMVVEDRREVEPAPADDLEVGEVGLPELFGRRGLVLNSSAAFTTMKAGLVIRSCALSNGRPKPRRRNTSPGQ